GVAPSQPARQLSGVVQRLEGGCYVDSSHRSPHRLHVLGHRRHGPKAKKEAYRIVLLRLMASEQEVLEKVKLKELSRDDGVEIMSGFGEKQRAALGRGRKP